MPLYPDLSIDVSFLKSCYFQIDVEKLAGFLPLHLIAVLMSSDRDEALFKYLSCGIRLLHSLCDLAPRHAKIEQVDCSTFDPSFILFLFYCSHFLFYDVRIKELCSMLIQF